MRLKSGRNEDIRIFASAKRVYMYELAEHLGMSESALYYHLRGKLNEERRTKILQAIDELAQSR